MMNLTMTIAIKSQRQSTAFDQHHDKDDYNGPADDTESDNSDRNYDCKVFDAFHENEYDDDEKPM